MNIPRSMVEAVARHMHAESQTCVYTDKGEEWARLDARSKESWIQLAEPILRAAIGCAEVVLVRTNDTAYEEAVEIVEEDSSTVGDACPLYPGDSAFIVRGEKGGTNGAG